MTPIDDEDRFMLKLGRLIDSKLAPVITRIEKIEGENKQQDRGIRDARVEVTRSKHDITEATNDSLLAASKHIATSVETVATNVEQFRTEVRAELTDFGGRLGSLEKQGAAQLVEVSDGRGTKSLMPASAIAAKGAESAAVAGANAAIDGKTNALAAKVSAHRTLIAQIITTLLIALWQLYEHFAHVAPHIGP